MSMTTIINNLVHPVTPELVKSIGHGSFLLGSLFAAMSFANFLASPFWGRLSDKYGRKPFLIMAPICYGFSQIGFGFSTNPYIIIFFRLLAGSFSCASFVSGMAYLIDVSNINNRSKIIALYAALTGFASTMGYLIGGVIGNDDYHITFIVQSSISIFSSLFILIFIKESHERAVVAKKGNVFKDFGKYRNTYVPFLLFIMFISSFSGIGFNNSFNSYLKFVLELRPQAIGVNMALSGLIGLVMNIVIFPLVKRKFNDYYFLIISCLSMSVSLALAVYLIKINLILSVMLLVIFFAFLALFRPLLQSIISNSGSNAHGEIMGLSNAFSSLGNVGGSFYAGAVFALNVDLSFYSISIVGLITFILLMLKRKQIDQYG